MAVFDFKNNIPIGVLGNTVGYVSNGKYILRSRPRKSNRPPTPAQSLNREIFEKRNRMYKVFKNAIRFIDTGKPVNKSNLFSDYNKNLYRVENGLVVGNIENIKLTDFSFPPLKNLTIDRNDSFINFRWDFDGMEDSSFKVVAWAYSEELNKVFVNETDRSSLFCTIQLPINLKENLVMNCFGYKRE